MTQTRRKLEPKPYSKLNPDLIECRSDLKVGHAYYAGEAHRAERNARVDALLNFYGLVDDKVRSEATCAGRRTCVLALKLGGAHRAGELIGMPLTCKLTFALPAGSQSFRELSTFRPRKAGC